MYSDACNIIVEEGGTETYEECAENGFVLNRAT